MLDGMEVIVFSVACSRLTCRYVGAGFSLPLAIQAASFHVANNDLQGALDLLTLETFSQLDSVHGFGISAVRQES
jgi:hypothetical protein